jgi:head-tail adaptor
MALGRDAGMMIGAGQRGEIVRLQRLQQTADGAGGFTREWVTWKTLRAQVRPRAAGTDLPIADGLQGVQSWRIIVNYQRDVIGIDHRIVWRDQVLVVRGAADETGRRQNTTIFADSGVVTG